MNELCVKLDCGRLNWIDLVAEKAIADLEILVSGHTRMALGNTRMRWQGTRMALGNTRMDEKDDVLNVDWSLVVRVWGSGTRSIRVISVHSIALGVVANSDDEELVIIEMAGRGRDDAAIAEALGMLAGVLGGNPNVVGMGAPRQLSEFQKNNPPMFKGAYDPDGAQKWLKEIERIFRVTECADN
ncbi:hypothetical protein KIW84_021549 [Lathyrus oleraceus]|uniref:Uncharacterized protein n=1 Tax=Pisum sativum TaxID=3888 RepID=A0A9D4Y851_PEA|nr:hypothetical protein KIW84_021549 [Pisum sativum]